jgi:hypothetical protein
MKVSRIMAVASFVLTTLSCGSQGGSGDGKITVLLKDAPSITVQEAVVTISEVDLVGPSGKVVLTTTPLTTDLLTLATQTATLVEGAVIPAGPYSQLRFVITGGYMKVADVIYSSSPDYAGLPSGATPGGELRMPSYEQSGLKVILPAGFTVGTDSKLVVDFDVSQSFGHDTGSGDWVMHPVVKATEAKDTGAIAVTLKFFAEGFPDGYQLTDFKAALLPPGADATTQPTLGDLTEIDATTVGVTFPFLVPGDYQVSFVAPDGMAFKTEPEVPQTVSVVAGQTASADFLLTAAYFPAP